MQEGTGATFDGLAAFLRGPISAFLGTADALGAPDATRIVGLAPVGPSQLRVLISERAETSLRNSAVGARVAVLATDITTYRSIQWKGRVVRIDTRSPGDTALLDQHATAFRSASDAVGLPVELVWKLFATDGVPIVVEVDELWNQTPGSGAGGLIGGTG